MKKAMTLFAGLAFLLINLNSLYAQDEESGVLDGAYVRKHIEERKPVPLQYIREADVMWSKKIWRMIPLKEKMNHKFYYPERPIQDRYSMIDLLMKAVENNEIKAYDANADDFNEFKEEISLEEIKLNFGAVDEEIEVEDENGNITKKKIKGEYNSKEVKEYMIKEEWVFDKQRSVMDVRIIGICPIRHYYKPEDIDQENVQRAKLFWVYYPELRKILINNYIFNPKNDAQYQSYEDIFLKRMFASYIIKESNVYNNRTITQYTLGIEALYEAERIKESIFNFELDLWEY